MDASGPRAHRCGSPFLHDDPADDRVSFRIRPTAPLAKREDEVRIRWALRRARRAMVRR